jgi:phage recombination protein Bet
MNQIATIERPQGAIAAMAQSYGMDRERFVQTLMATIMPANTSQELVAAFCVVAHQYKLNPFTKEIFAFPSRGGIQPVVSVDGWMKLINSHPDFDGMTFKDSVVDGKIESITCMMHRKNHTHPIEVTEYMSECRRNTDTWKQWPARMLRHKAAIQAARYAFGFAGIMEPDEYERMPSESPVQEVSIEDKRKQLHDEAAEQYEPSITKIKDQIAKFDADNDNQDALYTVAETWAGVPVAAQMDLWLAPTKGGIFTTHERDVIKTKLPKVS